MASKDACKTNPAAAAVTAAIKKTTKVVKANCGKTPLAVAISTPGSVANILPNGYGWVVLTAIGSVMMVTWKALKVGQARDEYKVPYPLMYSPENNTFNCFQRAHQNTLENYPQFLFLLAVGGLESPYMATIAGWIWIFGRIAYAKGYYTGDPRRRARGTFSIIGMCLLGYYATKFAFRHLSSLKFW